MAGIAAASIEQQLSFDGVDEPGGARPAGKWAEPSKPTEVVVFHTGVGQTLEALPTAASLAAGLGVPVRLVVPQLVPYPLPVEQIPVSASFVARRYRSLLETCSLQTRIEVCACRDLLQGMLHNLPPRSMVVLGGRRRWWRSPEQRMAVELRKRGHNVFFFECE